MNSVGCDIIEISRIKKAMENPKFLSRWFTNSEIEMFKSKNYKPETIAGNFCAKEAFVKALGSGFYGIKLKDIEVLRNEIGQPYIKSKFLKQSCSVSISHCREFAMSVVLIEVDN